MCAAPMGMIAAGDQRTDGDALAAWAEGLASRRKGMQGGGCLRFAFYGRVSTEDWQDPVTSRARQLQQAIMLVAGRGAIAAEFFDTGQSRALPWARRPQAAALVGQLADPDRGWDAIVIGEYERAFYGNQYASMAPLFEHYGIGLWMPEVGGRVDWHAEDHEQTMLALGLSSKREITRTRIRVRTAMAAQTREQGRYLGGRPPYGYRLADAGPHPNKAHAARGRRAHRLEPDPATAPVVTWMFAQRLAGHSAARITRALNDAGVPCPSAADPGRNPHRTGAAWTLRTVAAILANPRYTGRQVWNRQRTDFDLADPANTTLGHKQVQRWNLPEGWVISKHPAHAALVSEADFIAAQDTAAPRGLRPVRPQAGISVVQQQTRLQVPPRPHQRDPPRTRTAPEHLRARGPDHAAPSRDRHPARRPSRDPCPREPRPGSANKPGRDGSPDRPAPRRRSPPHLRPGRPDPAHQRSRCSVRHHRQGH
jgi:site-specific DNA recombinase